MLILVEEGCLEWLSECRLSAVGVSELFWKQVPDKGSGNWECPTAKWCGTVSKQRCAECSRWLLTMSETGTQQSNRYCSALLWRHRWTVTPSLYHTQSATSSQCKSACRICDSSLSYLLVPLRRAALYSTHCSLTDGRGGRWLVLMEWRPARFSMCLPLLISPCTIKSRSSLLAPAHPGGPRKRAVKWLWWCGGRPRWAGEFHVATWAVTKHRWTSVFTDSSSSDRRTRRSALSAFSTVFVTSFRWIKMMMILASESQRKGNNAPPVRSPVLDEERMRHATDLK